MRKYKTLKQAYNNLQQQQHTGFNRETRWRKHFSDRYFHLHTNAQRHTYTRTHICRNTEIYVGEHTHDIHTRARTQTQKHKHSHTKGRDGLSIKTSSRVNPQHNAGERCGGLMQSKMKRSSSSLSFCVKTLRKRNSISISTVGVDTVRRVMVTLCFTDSSGEMNVLTVDRNF